MTTLFIKISNKLLWIGIFLAHATSIAQVPTGTLIEKVVASVDDQPILQSELETAYQWLQQSPKLAEKTVTRQQILESMIINKVLLANAIKKDIHIKKEEIEQHLNAHLQSMLQQVGSEARLEQYTGKSLQAYKEELKKSITEQLILERIHHTIIDDITISPTEVQSFFEELSPNELPAYPASVEAYHLVLYPQVNEQEKEAIKEKLKSLQLRIQAGEDFAMLAKQYSEDMGTASSGGEIGFWQIGDLDPAYEKAMLTLRPGEISDPIETKFGLHIIQLIDRQKGRYNTRHILLKPKVVKSNIADVLKRLDSIRNSILEKEITFEKAVTSYSQDIATVQKRGLLTYTSEGTQMPVDKLPAELFFILDKMTPGTISQPLTFTTPSGEQAARIIYFKEKVSSHQANLKQDYEKIYKLALAAKKHRALEEWIEMKKAKSTIYIDPAYKS